MNNEEPTVTPEDRREPEPQGAPQVESESNGPPISDREPPTDEASEKPPTNQSKAASVWMFVGTAVSIIAALFSSFMAYKSWDYSRYIGRAAVSLQDVNVEVQRTAPDSVHVRLLFILENIGDEPLTIDNIATGYVRFDDPKWVPLTENHSLVNTIQPGAVFNHPLSFNLENIDPNLTASEIQKEFPDWVGKMATVLVVDYTGELSGHRNAKYYIGYKGKSRAYQLSMDEYTQIERYLPASIKRGQAEGN